MGLPPATADRAGKAVRDACAAKGDFDVADMFRRLEAKGFEGRYMNAFGPVDDMPVACQRFVEAARAADVAVD